MRNTDPRSSIPPGHTTHTRRNAGRANARKIFAACGALLLVPTTGCTPTPPRAKAERVQLAEAYRDLSAGNPDEAIAAADAFLAARPPAAAGPGVGEAWCARGRGFEAKADAAGKARRPAEARQHLLAAGDAYARAIAARPPRDVEGLARAGLANVAFFLDDYATALREWPAALPLTDDPDSRAWMLYRVGVCQLRTGAFEDADRTLERVQREHPSAAGGAVAHRAREVLGTRAFHVQVATFSSPSAADQEVANLKKQGIAGFREADAATGRQFVRVGPVPTFAAARATQARVAGRYPDALILP